MNSKQFLHGISITHVLERDLKWYFSKSEQAVNPVTDVSARPLTKMLLKSFGIRAKPLLSPNKWESLQMGT